jgi:hypothetical protein
MLRTARTSALALAGRRFVVSHAQSMDALIDRLAGGLIDTASTHRLWT